VKLPIRCKKPFTEELGLKIIDMFQNGMTVSAISRDLEMSYPAINNFLINNEIKKVKHCKLSEEKISQIINMVKDGVHSSEIARLTGSTCTTVSNIAKENGLTLNTFKMPRDEKNINFVDDYFSIIDTEAKAYFLVLFTPMVMLEFIMVVIF